MHITCVVSPKKTSLSFTSGERMSQIPFSWIPMDPANPAALTGALSTLIPVASANNIVYWIDPVVYESMVLPSGQHDAPTAVEVVRRRRAEENAAIRLVHLLITCTGAIEAGDYSVAHGNLSEARTILKAIPTLTGIGRVGNHFADALGQRLFPAYPHAAPAPPPPATQADLHNSFYDAGPYLKFAYSMANQAILDAFKGYNHVHIIDFALMQGIQWIALMDKLSRREGGPPKLRITGISSNPTGGHDEIHEVGTRLAKYARSVGVCFTFQGVCIDQLDGLCDRMHLKTIRDEPVAINSILQLHRLLVDPDADPAVLAPIDNLLKMVLKLKPVILTVVEQEADHNRPSLLERFTNALFHYAAMFDSLEVAMRHRTSGGSTTNSRVETYLRGEIFDIVCGEGSARTERHELLGRWRERLTRAGLIQVPFGPSMIHMVADQLRSHMTSLFNSGFNILECAGSLALSWHGRPLYVATAWREIGGNATGGMADTKG